jgi:hypothetical protein
MPKGNYEGYRADNKFGVPKKAWGSWTLVARHTFNKTYESMKSNQGMMRHSKTESLMPDSEWKVICWNAAWTAASVVSRGERIILADLTNKVKG